MPSELEGDRAIAAVIRGLAFLAFALITRARVQAHRLSSVLAVHEGVPRAMDHHSLGCLPAEKFPTSASHRQDRGATTLSDFRCQFHLTRLRDVAQEGHTSRKGILRTLVRRETAQRVKGESPQQ